MRERERERKWNETIKLRALAPLLYEPGRQKEKGTWFYFAFPILALYLLCHTSLKPSLLQR
jgi:hypothetical protein